MPFFVSYGGMLFLLGIYAVGWQWILGKLPLGVAFSNKAVSILWGICFGHYIFHEAVSWRVIIGAVCIIAGVILLNNRQHEH